MNKKLFSVLAALFTLFIAAAQTADMNTPVPLDPNVRTGKLANGMTYFIMKNEKPEHRAELRLAVNVGSTQENDNQQGLAHLTEHMAFNGTKHFAKNDLVDYIESIGSRFGADLNAYTSFDETVYMLQIPTDSPAIYDKGFQILEDWAHNQTMDSVEIDKERGVVIEEWRLGQGAQERMRRQYWPTMFKDSRYAVRLPIGKPEIVKNASYETLRSFYRDWYRPENEAIIVVGDIDLDKTEAKIKEEFSKIPRSTNARPVQSFQVPDSKGVTIAKATDKEATYTAIQVIYKQPKQHIKTTGDLRRDMTEDLYNTMLGNRLKELKQQADPPFIAAGSQYSGLVRTKDAYTSFAIVKDGGIERGLDAVATENERVKKYGFTAPELARAKKEMMKGVEKEYNERDKTDSRSLVGELVGYYLQQEPDPGITYEYNFDKKYLDGISLQDVNGLAQKWMTGDNVVVIITAPAKDSASLPSDSKIKSVLASVSTKDIKPYEDKAMSASLLTTTPIQGKITEEKENKELGTTTWKLSNGVTVIIKPTDFKNDEIIFNSFSFGGTSLSDDKDYLTASHIASIYDNSGVGDFDKVSLEKWLTGKIVGVSPFISEVQQGMRGNCSPEDQEAMMQMIYLYFTRPNRNETDYKAYIEQLRGFLQNRNSSPDASFQDTVAVTMGQYNYRTLPMSESRLSEIDPNRGYEIYKERFGDADGFTFVFVGNIQPEKFKPLVEIYLGGLPSTKKKENFKDVGIRPPKGDLEKTIVKGIAPKSSVSIKLTGSFDYNYKNRNDLSLLMQLASIKLRETLREDMSGVYGVRATPSTRHYPKEQYEISIGFGCAPGMVDTLVQAAWVVLNKIKENGCDDKDLQKLREIAIRERETNLKENRFWLSTLYNSAVDKENPDEILSYTNYINSLKSDDFKHLANKYFTKENMAEFVLKPVSEGGNK